MYSLYKAELKKIKKSVLIILILSLFVFTSCAGSDKDHLKNNMAVESVKQAKEFDGSAYTVINDNRPEFTEKEKQSVKSFERYSDLDKFGRCGVAFANISPEIMPTEKRGSIGMIKPSGWHTVRYDDLISDKYLYNRCHLIGFQLAGENANEKNLITGTRFMNVEGMLPFEDKVADYVKSTGNHVLYRVTPYFKGDNFVASGVQIEAYSVEDKGTGISFNVYCYNNQPGVIIDYATGESRRSDEKNTKKADAKETTYIINTNTGKFHRFSCRSVSDIKPENKREFMGTKEQVKAQGYEPCGNCRP